MSVAKVFELSATSTKSFDAAIAEGIAKANKGPWPPKRIARLVRRSACAQAEGGLPGAPIS